ncbi:hypothetical protein [Pseudorhodoferax sp. Leaf267]|uniref:hypothetical protein n=1 Tax=Pseudorhodoferax sp. Leaf267 TaxID=1736316 RepID=UPI0012E14866|nr:hypothetical protein [Pseudorhodoferax sp. Leaf267]
MKTEVNIQAENLHGWIINNKTYTVLSVEKYSSQQIGFRIESEDRGQPVLLPAILFNIIDHSLPRCWKVLEVRENSLDLGPAVFAEAEFWEKCFDQEVDALSKYREAKNQVEQES